MYEQVIADLNGAATLIGRAMSGLPDTDRMSINRVSRLWSSVQAEARTLERYGSTGRKLVATAAGRG